MFIIIQRDDFYGLEIIIDSYAKPKQFKSDKEAYDYAKEMELFPFQIIKVTI
jgi:hypothetical protein